MRFQDHAYFESIHNVHKGERAFVLATGPSIEHMDIGRLKGEYTVGINHLILWKDLPFIPTAWAQSEFDGRDRVAKEVAHLDIPKWWANQNWPDFDETWKWLYKDPKVGFHQTGNSEWKWRGNDDALGLRDEFWRVANAYSPVQESAIPVLLWQGFTHIYLCGVNHTRVGHVYDEELVTTRPHTRLSASTNAYINMQTVMNEHGRTLINCTADSEAPVPYESLDSVLGVKV